MKNIIGILLAAGNSIRFGGDKLSYPLPDGESIGLTSGRKLINVLTDSVAVVRAGDVQLTEELVQLGFRKVIQPNPAAGMGNSIARGIQAAQHADGWLIILADMPWIQTETLQHIAGALVNGAAIAAPVFQGRRGHPVGFSQQFQEELAALDGDSGAKKLLKTHAAMVQLLPVDDRGIVQDVDRRTDI
ncbi:MAG: nucleotidyltransferase family protein [Candidatus Electrothrix sp. Rat3]|nr:nucleotidyltransferase family protein [Candidatus Electrothrix rattekaaiensis]